MTLALRPVLVLLGALWAGCGPRGGPQGTLEAYLAAVEADHPHRAYELLDPSVQRQVSRADFVKRWKGARGEIVAQAQALRAALRRPLVLKGRLDYGAGVRAHLAYVDNHWKIEEGVTLAAETGTPLDTLRAFVIAVERRDYASVLRLLAVPVKESIERDIEDRLSRLKAGLKQEIEVIGNKARLQYDPRYKIELVKEGAQWRISDFD